MTVSNIWVCSNLSFCKELQETICWSILIAISCISRSFLQRSSLKKFIIRIWRDGRKSISSFKPTIFHLLYLLISLCLTRIILIRFHVLRNDNIKIIILFQVFERLKEIKIWIRFCSLWQLWIQWRVPGMAGKRIVWCAPFIFEERPKERFEIRLIPSGFLVIPSFLGSSLDLDLQAM